MPIRETQRAVVGGVIYKRRELHWGMIFIDGWSSVSCVVVVVVVGSGVVVDV